VFARVGMVCVWGGGWGLGFAAGAGVGVCGGAGGGVGGGWVVVGAGGGAVGAEAAMRGIDDFAPRPAVIVLVAHLVVYASALRVSAPAVACWVLFAAGGAEDDFAGAEDALEARAEDLFVGGEDGGGAAWGASAV
jgi:hypothetical protein